MRRECLCWIFVVPQQAAVNLPTHIVHRKCRLFISGSLSAGSLCADSCMQASSNQTAVQSRHV